VSADKARSLAEEWMKDRPTRFLFDRNTGKIVGIISEDGYTAIRYPHTDPGTPQLHWNLVDKITGDNVHVVIE
jgi:hypothetical protein